jgi:plastocyanin
VGLTTSAEATVPTDGSLAIRTLAMNVVSVGYVLVTLGLTYLVILFLRAGDDFQGATLITVFTSIVVIVAAIGTLSVVWSGARSRAWFWLVSAIPAALILLLNAPFLAYDITRPTITETFVRSLLVLAGGLAVVLGGVTAFFEVRRGSPIRSRSGRAGWVSAVAVGALIGSIVTSVLAGSVSAAGAGVAQEPTVSAVLTIEDNAFLPAGLRMEAGDVLGLFIVNEDPFPHSFDIDDLGIHVQLLPNSTTAVAIQPSGPEDLDFFCGVPGHAEAGMVGAIEVNA